MLSANVKVLCARFNGAKHVLYEVPTYLAGCPIGTLNKKKQKEKKRWQK